MGPIIATNGSLYCRREGFSFVRSFRSVLSVRPSAFNHFWPFLTIFGQKTLKNNVFCRFGHFSIFGQNTWKIKVFGVRKIVKMSLTKIGPYQCVQSELEADF